MEQKDKTYLAIVKIKGHKPDDYIMTGKNSVAVKQTLISFFKKVLGENVEIEVETMRIERIDGDYIRIK